MNLILIGMPGSGKSTAGVVLAKALGYDFLDTDLLIQNQTGQQLQELIEARGLQGFLALEETVVTTVRAEHTVIATGGSVIFGASAMDHLRSLGRIVYLQVPLPELIRRLSNIRTRGVVMKPGESLADVYRVRTPLYEQYADVTIDTTDCTLEEVVEMLVKAAQA